MLASENEIILKTFIELNWALFVDHCAELRIDEEEAEKILNDLE